MGVVGLRSKLFSPSPTAMGMVIWGSGREGKKTTLLLGSIS